MRDARLFPCVAVRRRAVKGTTPEFGPSPVRDLGVFPRPTLPSVAHCATLLRHLYCGQRCRQSSPKPRLEMPEMTSNTATKHRKNRPPQGSIRAVRHTVDVLRRISESRKPLGINELARRVGIDKSSVSRLVATLEGEYLVCRD